MSAPAPIGRKLPRPLKIPAITTLRTLGNIRALLGHLPAERRDLNTWRHVADRLNNAARGGNIEDAVIALRLVLQLEQVPCLLQWPCTGSANSPFQTAYLQGNAACSLNSA